MEEWIFLVLGSPSVMITILDARLCLRSEAENQKYYDHDARHIGMGLL